MNYDKGFEQRWEFRRKEVDGDTSSDDNRSNSSGDPKARNLLEKDEASDALGCEKHDDKPDTYTGIHSHIAKAEEKNTESSKKKKVVQKKSSARLNVKEKSKRKVDTNEMVMLKDLKIFADSLIHDLAVAQDNMFEHMREEMRKLVASRSNLELVKKNVKRSQKKKVCRKNGPERDVKPQRSSGGTILRNVQTNVGSDHARKFPEDAVETGKHETRTNELLQRFDRLRQPPTVPMNITYCSNQVVSSSQLPTVVPKPQFQDQRNRILLNDHISSGMPLNNLGLEIEIGQRFGSFSQSRHQGVGLLGQNSSQGIGLLVSTNRGTDICSNVSSLSYCENSIMDDDGVGLTMKGSIARFPGRTAEHYR